MSIIIRLQNLPWSANSVDIRRFFVGLSIPEGGVHIVGGEMGDAFIAFSTDEDARLAMAKDGGKIKDMQIKLLLSSRTEMMRVIEQARQQNTPVVAQQHMMPQMQTPILQTPMMQQMQTPMMPLQQQPVRNMPPASDPDRRRGRSPTSSRHRERSPGRDRRRSPDERRKRERSRSPGRSNRSFSRDDRRMDDRRYKRDDRRYEDSRYREDRRSTSRDNSEPKKYSDGDSRPPHPEGYRDMQHVYDAVQNIAMSGLFQYGSQQNAPAVKSIHDSYLRSASDSGLDKAPMVDQKQAAYAANQALFHPSSPFGDPNANNKSASEQQAKLRRRSRFEPDNVQQANPQSYADKLTELQNQSSAYSIKRAPGNIPDNRNAWGPSVTNSASNSMTANGDLVQVVPMDLDPPEPDTLIETVSPNVSYSYGRPSDPTMSPNKRNSMSSINQNREVQSESQLRHSPLRNEQRSRGPFSSSDGQNRFNMSNEMANRGDKRNSSMRGDMYNTGSHGDNQNRIPSSLTVEVKGMAPDARIDDILDLFRGISLPAANIRIEASDRGFEKAFIRFTSPADFEEALNRNRRFVNEGRCELVPCPASAFEGARPQKYRPRPKPREEDLIVQLRGLPFSCKDSDVIKFFDGLTVLDLFVMHAADGRASGMGFVEFGSHKDFRAALVMNGKMIGHRYITVSVGSKEMMVVSRDEDYNPESSNDNARNNDAKGPRPPPMGSRPPLLPSAQIRPQVPMGRQPPCCIFMKKLPDTVTNQHIADFLSQAHVMPRAIHIMLRPDNQMPSGEAYAEFSNSSTMESALQLNGKMMSGQPIELLPISFFEMSEILGRPVPLAPTPEGGLLRTPGLDRPRGPLLSKGPRERPRPDFPPRPMRPRMDGPPGRPPFGPPRMRGPWPPRPRLEGRFPAPPASDRGPKDFGSPGCVVSIDNLHFRAGLEELLDFFQGYNITKDSIIRKYNERGQTTGEARVSFQSPQDAQKVVEKLNQRPIMGRPLALSIV